jgi:sugar lactone lactonase YvrE
LIAFILNGGVVTTLAGQASTVFANGTGTTATFNAPQGVKPDSSGNVYVGDTNNNRIRFINSSAVVSTFAGTGTFGISDNIAAASASFRGPRGVAIASDGTVYVADSSNHRIRKISAGFVTTLAGTGASAFADGTGTNARFFFPNDVTMNPEGNMYVADSQNNRIRLVTPLGVVTTFAGSGTGGAADGTGVGATFNFPKGVTVDSAGNVFVADWFQNRIRRITPAGVVTTVAGGGTADAYLDATGTNARFAGPNGIAVDPAGNLYVTDGTNNRIRRISPAGVVTTFAGNATTTFADGTGTNARFNSPFGIAINSAGTLFITDANHRIRRVV